jgi:hypothetical protein
MGERRTEDGQWRDEAEARRSLGELARTGESIAQFARRRGISGQRVYYLRDTLAKILAGEKNLAALLPETYAAAHARAALAAHAA